MGEIYAEETRPGKKLVTGDQIANGAINLNHLSKELFAEFRQLSLHNHSGNRTRRIKMEDLEGSYNQGGIAIRSPNGAVWHIKVSNAGVISAS